MNPDPFKVPNFAFKRVAVTLASSENLLQRLEIFPSPSKHRSQRKYATVHQTHGCQRSIALCWRVLSWWVRFQEAQQRSTGSRQSLSNDKLHEYHINYHCIGLETKLDSKLSKNLVTLFVRYTFVRMVGL